MPVVRWESPQAGDRDPQILALHHENPASGEAQIAKTLGVTRWAVRRALGRVRGKRVCVCATCVARARRPKVHVLRKSLPKSIQRELGKRDNLLHRVAVAMAGQGREPAAIVHVILNGDSPAAWIQLTGLEPKEHARWVRSVRKELETAVSLDSPSSDELILTHLSLIRGRQKGR